MKRKRSAGHDQKQENSSSTKSFRSNVTGKLQTLFSGFVSELQSIPDIKREDVALIFNPKCKEANSAEVSTAVNTAFHSIANPTDKTEVLQNFINSAKSRISGLLRSRPENQVSNENNSLKNFQPHPPRTKTKTLSIDSLEFQINLKFQSVLFKALDTKQLNNVNEKQDLTTSESIITAKDWQDLSQMLQDFSQSAKKKLHASLTKEKNDRFLNGPVAIQNSNIKENKSSSITQPTPVSQRKSHNKELQKPSTNKRSSSFSHLSNDSNKVTEKKRKLLKMDCSSESTSLRSPNSNASLSSPATSLSNSSGPSSPNISSPNISTSSGSPRNPFDENCMLLLSDAEKCPAYVELQLSSESDMDEIQFDKLPNFFVEQSKQESVSASPNSLGHHSESEDEVIVLGEKSKTYQEVTLEEDDDGKVHESVVEKIVEKHPKEEKEIKEEKDIGELFNCPKCNKSFRVQSLLQFHIKMHAAESILAETSTSSSENESHLSEKLKNLSQRVKKKRKNTKSTPKLSTIKKNYRDKSKKHKNKEISKFPH